MGTRQRALARWLRPAAGARPGRLGVAVVAALVAAACVVLYAVPPGRGGFYPPCPFHALTGCHCPGCGTLRALHALLGGRLADALGHNALAVLSLPGLAWALLSRVRRAWWGRPLPMPLASAGWAWLLLGLVLAFWLLRNIPVWPCSLLAP